MSGAAATRAASGSAAPPAPDAAAAGAPRAAYKWELVGLLWLAFFLNQADRQVFNVVLPLVRADLGLTDAQLGLIASAFIAVYAAFVPVAGYAGDVVSRRSILVASLVFWSAATLLTGSAGTLAHLLLLRSVATGGGEAFYAPSANALIGAYHDRTRAVAMSVHQTAVYVGIVASGLVSGYVGERYGWRSAFYLFGGLGLALGVVLYVRLRRDVPPARAGGGGSLGAPPVRFAAALGVVLRTPTALLLTLAFACMVFVNVGYLTWTPTFLYERFGLSLARAGFASMFYHHAAAAAGALLGARFADRRAAAGRGDARLLVQAGGLLLGAPFIFWVGAGPSASAVYLALAAFGFFRGAYDSNLFASLYEVVEPRYRSSATGVMLMGAFLAGASAPYLLGAFKPTLGLARGLSSLAVLYVVGAVLVFVAHRAFFTRDRARAAAAGG